ncbi:MAG: RluA family pseudouridine synthase [Clostridia bacterium]|nr:RluA family pseudouridine synthase [Clostridia bacterium]
MNWNEPYARRLSLTVLSDWEGKTVDVLLRRELKLSGTVIRRVKWLDDGILLDGERVATNQKVRAGQVLTILVGDGERRSDILPAPGPLEVVYEDEDLLVVNKAPGVSVHPGPGHYDDTLGNFVLYYYETRGENSDYHPVHRLDRGTSGLMVVAKHAHAQERLKGQLHTGAFRRTYLAVCEGAPAPPAGIVDAPIGREENSLFKREVRPDGAEARTRYEVVRSDGKRSLVRFVLETGRTHQIRVHMAYLGYPLTGDFLYGTEDKALIARPALHSAELELLHPVTGERLSFRAALPEDMRRLL